VPTQRKRLEKERKLPENGLFGGILRTEEKLRDVNSSGGKGTATGAPPKKSESVDRHRPWPTSKKNSDLSFIFEGEVTDMRTRRRQLTGRGQGADAKKPSGSKGPQAVHDVMKKKDGLKGENLNDA